MTHPPAPTSLLEATGWVPVVGFGRSISLRLHGAKDDHIDHPADLSTWYHPSVRCELSVPTICPRPKLASALVHAQIAEPNVASGSRDPLLSSTKSTTITPHLPTPVLAASDDDTQVPTATRTTEVQFEGARILLGSCVSCSVLKNRCDLQAQSGVYVYRRHALSPSQGGRTATTRASADVTGELGGAPGWHWIWESEALGTEQREEHGTDKPIAEAAALREESSEISPMRGIAEKTRARSKESRGRTSSMEPARGRAP